MIEHIKYKNKILAIILRSNFKKKGIHFFTPRVYSLQLGYMNRPKGYKIKPHFHKDISKIIKSTNEALFIKFGKVRVDFFNDAKKYVLSKIIEKGDVVLLVTGGHGFEMLKKSEIIEVKQGPFIKKSGKIMLKKIKDFSIKIK